MRNEARRWNDRRLKAEAEHRRRVEWHYEPPPELWAERDRAYAAPRDLTAELFGDPRPGRSALDRERR